MENQHSGLIKEDVLTDSALMPYDNESGVAIYIDYLTPTFHIPANLDISLIR